MGLPWVTHQPRSTGAAFGRRLPTGRGGSNRGALDLLLGSAGRRMAGGYQ